MKKQDCYSFWKLAKSLKVDDIVALWCDVEPSQLNHFIQTTGYSPSCADAKRVVIEDALVSGELDYIDEGTSTSNGKLWIGNPVEELIQKSRLRINKECLKNWFILKYEEGYLEEIPNFLNEEKQQAQVLQQQRKTEPLADEDLHPRSKSTATKIIYALLIQSGWDNTSPNSQNRDSANCEIQTVLSNIGITVGSETIGKFLKDVNKIEKEYPRLVDKPPF